VLFEALLGLVHIDCLRLPLSHSLPLFMGRWC
jgi:hypothetical protein